MNKLKMIGIFVVLFFVISCSKMPVNESNNLENTPSTGASVQTPDPTKIPVQTPDPTEAPVQTPLDKNYETMENSPTPTQQPEESKENMEPKNEEIGGIYGKWKILDMVGHGYIFGEFSMEDYVGGVVTIDKDYMERDLPMGKSKLENPEYKLTKQSENEFLEGTKVSVENIFGFKPDKIQMVEVRNGYDGFVRFWIRDETHLIFHGPVYFLAEKVE